MQSGLLTTEDGRARLQWIVWGSGSIPLVYIPGGGGGLSRPHQAIPRITWGLRRRPQDYRILHLSRRDPIGADVDLEQHARDMLWAMDQLGRGPSIIEAQSAGGPIAQQMAVQRPDQVLAMVQCATTAWLDEEAEQQIADWVRMLRSGKLEAFVDAVNQAMWKPRTLTLLKPFAVLMRASQKTPDVQRMSRIMEGLLGLDHRALLPKIVQPTLVIGGDADRIFSARLQRELAQGLPNSQLILYPRQGHGLDLENHRAYEADVLQFCKAIVRGQLLDAS